MYGIVWRYLPKGSWRLAEKVYEDRERAEDEAAAQDDPGEVRAKAIYLGDAEDWK